MKLVRLLGPGQDNLRMIEEDYRQPGPGEVLVRIRACSLNFHDTMVISGSFPTENGRIPINDGAGDVIAVGEGVEKLRIGDRVLSTFFPRWAGGEPDFEAKTEIPGETIDGYACEFACRPERCFMKMPAGCSYLEAATLPCAGVTAWSALVTHGKIRPGETVLTLGTGGVSLFALQFAKMAGARVIATSSSEEKLEKLIGLGASDVINHSVVKDWGREAKRLTGGRGVDHVIEVGGPATMAQSIEACRMGGHIAMIGVLTGFTGEISVPAIFANQIRISGVLVGHRAEQEEMLRAVAHNSLNPVLDSTFALREIRDAFAHYRSQKHFGKVCIEL